MSIFRDLKTSRLIKFLLVHAFVCVAVSVYILSKDPHIHAPFLAPYFIGFLNTFLQSFAGSLLGIAQMAEGAFDNFAGMGAITLFGRTVPLAAISGAFSLVGLGFFYAGVAAYGKKMFYFIFLLASICIIVSAWAYVVETGPKNAIGHILPAQMDK